MMAIINTMPELEKETDDFGVKKIIKPILAQNHVFWVHDWKSRPPNWAGYRHMHQNMLSPTWFGSCFISDNH